MYNFQEAFFRCTVSPVPSNFLLPLSSRRTSQSHVSPHPRLPFPPYCQLMTVPQGKRRLSLSFYNQLYRPSYHCSRVFSTPVRSIPLPAGGKSLRMLAGDPVHLPAFPFSVSLIQLDLYHQHMTLLYYLLH